MSSLHDNEAEVDDGDGTEEEILPENADDRAFIYDGDTKSCSGRCRSCSSYNRASPGRLPDVARNDEEFQLRIRAFQHRQGHQRQRLRFLPPDRRLVPGPASVIRCMFEKGWTSL